MARKQVSTELRTEQRERYRLNKRAAYYLTRMAELPPGGVEVEGAKLQACVGVFDPRKSTSTAHLCSLIRTYSPAKRVLDIGTGTGAAGIVAALNGAARVLMTDSNPKAVECARKNALRNKVDELVEVICVSSAVEVGERFGLMIFAAPYLWFAAPSALRDRFGSLVDSMYDEDDRAKADVLHEATRLLEHDGVLLLQIGSISRVETICARAEEEQLNLRAVHRAPDGREEHLVLELVRRHGLA
jgi:release factor glutamine methyltransferase